MDTYLTMMTEFLKTATPEEWMFVATTTNYDDKELLSWMIIQNMCPESAALAIYWYLEPGYYTKYKSINDVNEYEVKSYHALRLIESSLANGRYAKSNIGFDPNFDSMSGIQFLKEYPKVIKGADIPGLMKTPVLGTMLTREDIPEGWDDGMPSHVVEAVWKELDEE